MTDTIKEITDFSPHHHFHPFDPEDPEAFSTCLEEKKHLLKSYQQRRYFGRHIPFCWRNNEPFLTLGPQCNFCIYSQWHINKGPLFLVTWCGLLGIGVFVIIHIPGNRSPLLRVSAVIVTIWQSMIYLLTALKNPGIVTAKDANDLTLLNSNCQAKYFLSFFQLTNMYLKLL
jgi:hypothetical protein